jgi:flagellum-specific peptidoglycan hydrolase FlgJ
MKFISLLFIIIAPIVTFGQSLSFPPTPTEDFINGRNNNCYSAAIGHPTPTEKQQFIESLKNYADSISLKTNLPPKTIMAMAILESGFGFTRTGYFANNLFGIKIFTTDSVNVYVLKGQPDENNGKNIQILKKTKKGEIIFNESIRTDNRYRKFQSKKESIFYHTNTLLQNSRYQFASTNYINNIKKGVSELEASLIYAFDIASHGYNHLGGDYYRKAIEKVIKQYKL